MSPPSKIVLRSLCDFWTRPIRAEPLALFRILIGIAILSSLLTSLAPRLGRDFGADGLYPGRAGDAWLQRSGRFCLLRGPVNLPLLEDYLPPESVQAWREWCDAPDHAAWLFAVLAGAVVCMTVGLCTRTATVVAWALFVSFNQRLAYLMNGGDSMMRCALFYLLFAPSGAAWSLDQLLRRRRGRAAPAPATIAPWPVRLMQIQLALMYFFTGLSKIGWDQSGGGDWVNGQAVYWVLNDLSVARWPYHWLPVPMIVYRLLSWGTLVFEIGFPFCVMVARRRHVCGVTIPALRPWALLAGLAFHLGILVHTEVGWFSPATLCWYALFLSGERVQSCVRLAFPRRPRREAEPAAKEEPQSAHPAAV